MTTVTTTEHPIDPSLTIESDATAALAEAQRKLDRLEGRSGQRERDALAGKLDAVDLANYRARLDLARTVRDAAAKVVDAERARIATPEALRAAVDEFLKDPALGTEPMVSALDAAKVAAAAAHTAITDRNQHLEEWRNRFRSLGVPATGLSIGQEQIRLHDFGGSISVEISGHAASTTTNAGKIVTDAIANRNQQTDAAAFARDDTRGNDITHADVRLVRDAGGHPAGTILSTRSGHTPSALRTLVSYGAGELISGELPEPSVGDERAEAVRQSQADRQAAASEYQVPRERDWI